MVAGSRRRTHASARQWRRRRELLLRRRRARVHRLAVSGRRVVAEEGADLPQRTRWRQRGHTVVSPAAVGGHLGSVAGATVAPLELTATTRSCTAPHTLRRFLPYRRRSYRACWRRSGACTWAAIGDRQGMIPSPIAAAAAGTMCRTRTTVMQAMKMRATVKRMRCHLGVELTVCECTTRGLLM